MPPPSSAASATGDATLPDAAPAAADPRHLRRIEWTRRAAAGSVLALIALGLAWELWLAVPPGGSGRLAIKVLPLCFTLPGLLKRRMYTYRWTSLLVWLYVTEALVRLPGERGLVPWLASAELVLSLLLFAACAAHVRLRLAHGRRDVAAADGQ